MQILVEINVEFYAFFFIYTVVFSTQIGPNSKSVYKLISWCHNKDVTLQSVT